MDMSLLLKVGVVVEVKEKNGRVSIGWLDEVGVTQAQGKILLTDKKPTFGATFKGRKINIEDIEDLKISNVQESNF